MGDINCATGNPSIFRIWVQSLTENREGNIKMHLLNVWDEFDKGDWEEGVIAILCTSSALDVGISYGRCPQDSWITVAFRGGLERDSLLYTCIYLSMALQPFVGPWPLFSFVILYTVGRTAWTGDQPVARPLPTHRHPCLEWDSNPWSHRWS
jgi:hypothetical protein